MIQQATVNNFFHHCGAIIILKKDTILGIHLPYCPTCRRFFNFEQYPHLAQQQSVISHSVKEQTLILENVPLFTRKNNGCKHVNKTLLQYHEGQKARVWRCNDCHQIIRERD